MKTAAPPAIMDSISKSTRSGGCPRNRSKKPPGIAARFKNSSDQVYRLTSEAIAGLRAREPDGGIRLCRGGHRRCPDPSRLQSQRSNRLVGRMGRSHNSVERFYASTEVPPTFLCRAEIGIQRFSGKGILQTRRNRSRFSPVKVSGLDVPKDRPIGQADQ